MKSTFRILFYLKRDKQKADGTVPVWCRITVDGQATRFHTKASINPNFNFCYITFYGFNFIHVKIIFRQKYGKFD